MVNFFDGETNPIFSRAEKNWQKRVFTDSTDGSVASPLVTEVEFEKPRDTESRSWRHIENGTQQKNYIYKS